MKSDINVLYMPCNNADKVKTLTDLLKLDMRFKGNEDVKNLNALDIVLSLEMSKFFNLLKKLGVAVASEKFSDTPDYSFKIMIDEKLRTVNLDTGKFIWPRNIKYDLVAVCFRDLKSDLNYFKVDYDELFNPEFKGKNKGTTIKDRCSAFDKYLTIDDIMKYTINKEGKENEK